MGDLGFYKRSISRLLGCRRPLGFGCWSGIRDHCCCQPGVQKRALQRVPLAGVGVNADMSRLGLGEGTGGLGAGRLGCEYLVVQAELMFSLYR
jgi:hypothetical protein